MPRVAPAKLILWFALALPALAMALDSLGASEPWLADYVAASGLWSARLLILALCLAPLAALIGHRAWLAWLLRHRRAIGVAAFLYTLLHLALYVLEMGAAAAIVDEAQAPAMAAGWLAAAAMAVPALISSDGAMRALGSGWKRLQRFAYPAALLTILHWALVHDGLSEALLHVAPLALLQAARLAKMFTTQRIYA
ncbi:ferric reductase-like transmembrane domain-containing protein [Sphingomonas mesophila]|uniref:ferric reductase-like transmembrane domain-containing protein n=1 Tax=Sphingomonas mesophila TaxID=2303576 RepID=UPI000E580C64|nr:ferric reductase-like transmembrane domain-containing protein [Sphingomonas mesophila]